MDITKGLQYVDHAFLWPHARFSYLYMNFKENFFQLFMQQDTEAMARTHIRKCWQDMASEDPRRASLQEGVGMTKVIPAWLHGDGVPCTKHDSYEVTSWGSMLTKWMWFASGYFAKTNHVGKKNDKSDDTKTMYIQGLNWSFRALAMGKWPDKDWQGKRWPKGSMGDKYKGQDLAGGNH